MRRFFRTLVVSILVAGNTAAEGLPHEKVAMDLIEDAYQSRDYEATRKLCAAALTLNAIPAQKIGTVRFVEAESHRLLGRYFDAAMKYRRFLESPDFPAEYRPLVD